MTKSFQKLKVTWEMPDPPVNPEAWAVVIPGPRSTGSEALSKRLGISSSGLDCLDAAFKLGLNRFTGWELEAPEHAQAARIFKRGVFSRYAGEMCQQSVQSGSYDISIVGDEEQVLDLIKHYADWTIICDDKVAKAWPHITKTLRPVTMPTSELSKNLITVAEIIDEIEDASGVVIVGGGVLGDMAGFAAALTNKPMALVPTTLLAMADACIGGKTGVNYPPHGKNQVGSFYFPHEVIVWDGWLKTLPQREMNAGIAECLKHMFLSGEMAIAEQISRRKIRSNLADIIKVKADVVAEDPAEQGVRATLNFGHTLAHALEAYSHQHAKKGQHILHGEAVALGTAFAVLLSHNAGYLEKEDMRRMGQILLDAKILPNRKQLLDMLGIAIDSSKLWPALLKLIAKDKKSTGSTETSNWILLDRPGNAASGPNNNYLIPVESHILAKTWQALLATI
jgi:3-dehydroquinate synthetase